MALVSPGVFINEIDLSQYAQKISTSIFGIVGGATKGPIDTLTLVTNESQFINTFGKPDAAGSSMMAHAAIQYLRQGNQLQVVRVATGSAAFATRTLNDSLAAATLVVTAITKGTWGNNVAVIVSAGSKASTFKIKVQDEFSVVAEIFDNLKKGTANLADPDYVNTRINGVSKLITVADTAANPNFPNFPVGGSATSFLTGGADGIPNPSSDQSTFIGTVSGTNPTGMQIFRDFEAVDVNIMAVPGVSTGPIVVEGISICSSRGDCFYLIDPPQALTVSQVIDYSNGAGSFTDHSAYNSSFAGLFWPWITYFDSYNNKTVLTPPSGWIAGQMAFTDRTSDPWFAPAGLNRGRLLTALSLEHSPTLGERETLYGQGQVINPIVKFVKDGITVYGQRTTQRTASALDRINVRRMLLYVEKIVATSVRFLVFEPNDETTWRRFIGIVDPLLRTVKSRRGLVDYQIICDKSTNTADLINNNQMRGLILLKPTKAAEIIQLDFTVLAQGTNFSEVLANP